MQVKKFEAPTLQEALESIKRELGPEAIILQTKQNRKGFGLMSKGSVEVTAAVSDRSLDKKKTVEKRIPSAYAKNLEGAPATKQADLYESFLQKKIEKDQVQIQKRLSQAESNPRITAVRYADIADDQAKPAQTIEKLSVNLTTPNIPEIKVPAAIENSLQAYSNSKADEISAIQEELTTLKKMVEELRREKRRPDFMDSDSPYAITDALQEAYEILLQSGVEKRFAVPMMREVVREVPLENRGDRETVLDTVAAVLLKSIETRGIIHSRMMAFVGTTGAGKTSILAKLATHFVRSRNEKIGIIRIESELTDTPDPLSVLAKALHVPYRRVEDRESFQSAIHDMAQCQRILIDTSSIQAKTGKGVEELQSILTGHQEVATHWVASSTTRDLELFQEHRAIQRLKPKSVIFTRLDEAFSLGALVTVSGRTKLPISIVTSGKKVTEDWENATPERITASIMGIV